MTWFFAILVVALLGGVAVVATGRGGSMIESYDDRPDALVPADGPLTASDLRAVRFTTAFRGYRMSEVDALLDRLAADLEPRQSREPRVVHLTGEDEPRSGVSSATGDVEPRGAAPSATEDVEPRSAAPSGTEDGSRPSGTLDRAPRPTGSTSLDGG